MHSSGTPLKDRDECCVKCLARRNHDSDSTVCQVPVEFQPAGKKRRRVGLQRLPAPCSHIRVSQPSPSKAC